MATKQRKAARKTSTRPKRSKRAAAGVAAGARGAFVVVRNVNVPSSVRNVDATKYRAMKHAMLQALPKRDPGLTQAEMLSACAALVDKTVFPGGNLVGWWAKTVQLDLEAQGVVVRDGKKPLRWRRAN